jgi:hypothetical protein
MLTGCPSGGSNSTYRLAMGITGIGEKYEQGTGNQINISTDTTYYFVIQIIAGITANNLTFYPMLQKGTKANSYTPYGTTPIELCKIGDYKDYFYKDSGKWYKYGVVEKIIFNGSENWKMWNISNVNTQRFYFDFSTNGATGLLGLCDRFTFETGYGDTEHFNISGSSGYRYNEIIIVINRNRLATVDVTGFKNYVSNNNIVFYRVLETPTDTEITYQPLIDQLNAIEKAMSYNGQTNISQVNNDLPFIISAGAFLNNINGKIALLNKLVEGM